MYTRGKRRVPTFCTAQSGERDPYLYEEGRGGWKSTLLTIAPMSAWGGQKLVITLQEVYINISLSTLR